MQDNKVLQSLYSVFLGVLLALFVGVGISTFYPAPKSPDYPQAIHEVGVDSVEQQQEQAEYDRQYANYQEVAEVYHRNVSIIALLAAVTFIVIAVVLENRIKVLSSGIMLGGIFTLLYSIGRGFAADDNRYVFLVLTISLAVVIYLGYRKFVSTPVKRK